MCETPSDSKTQVNPIITELSLQNALFKAVFLPLLALVLVRIVILNVVFSAIALSISHTSLLLKLWARFTNTPLQGKLGFGQRWAVTRYL